MQRIVGVVRLSVERDESTSPERQREIIAAAAVARQGQVIGWAEDLDISATKVPPLKRPALKSWLEKPDEFDELLFWRLDRFVRSPADLTDMIRWSRDHAKNLASATESFDLNNPFGEAMAYIASVFAGMESAATSERVAGSHKYLRQAGRWAGGKPPYGYVGVPSPDGHGWQLTPDNDTAPVVMEAASRVIAGEAANAIAADFNRRGIMSPRDVMRDEPTGAPWRATSLRLILRSPAILGHAVNKGKSVIGDDGMPVHRGPALISVSEFKALQAALDQNSRAKRRTQSPSLLLNVGYCTCGAPLYISERKSGGKVRRYYRCIRAARPSEHSSRCDALNMRAEQIDEAAELAFLSQVGTAEVMERKFVPGEDPTEEREQVRAALESARHEFDLGQYGYPGGQEDYQQRTARLSERLNALATIPVRPAGYVLKPVPGRTFAKEWETADVPARRKLMMDAGFEIRAAKTAAGFTFGFQTPRNLAARAVAAAAGQPVKVPSHDQMQATWELPAAGMIGANSLDELIRKAHAGEWEPLQPGTSDRRPE